MATHNDTGTTSLPAAADFSGLTPKGFRFVVKNGSGQAALCGAGARAFGVMDGDQVKAGQQTRIKKQEGKAQLKLDVGGTIALNDPIGSDATGQMVKITAEGAWVHGHADEAAVAGQVASYSPCAPYQIPAA